MNRVLRKAHQRGIKVTTFAAALALCLASSLITGCAIGAKKSASSEFDRARHEKLVNRHERIDRNSPIVQGN